MTLKIFYRVIKQLSMTDYNINTLPRELYNIVLNNLSVDELKNLSQTNKLFKTILYNSRGNVLIL